MALLKNINSILLITLSNIGDVILTTPVISVLKEQFPGAKLDIICGERATDLFKNDPVFRHIFTYNKLSSLGNKIKFIIQLRKQKYDLVVDLRNTLISCFLNAPYHTSFFERKNKSHMKDKHLKKLEGLKLNINQAPFHIHINREDRAFIDKKLTEDGIIFPDTLIAVNPGARSHIKRWTKDGFAQVIKDLLNNFKYKVVLVGDKDDLKLGEEISNLLSTKPLNLIGQTTLAELAYLLKKSALLITNDSACLHMASAIGTKTLAIFGPTDPKKYGPLADGSKVLRKNLTCSPCQVAQCRFNLECMKNIKPDEVISKIKEMI